jgi:hypothetical protein
MNKRSFLKSAAAVTALATTKSLFTSSAQAQVASPQGEYYELRVYTIETERQKQLIDSYWKNAGIPAFNRAGIKPIGVFTEVDKPQVDKVYVLIPYANLDSFAATAAKVAADPEHQKAGADYLDVPKKEPAFVRLDSSLLAAFSGMKKLEVPPSLAEKKPWIFELRTYESHSEVKGNKKVEMFNAGEIDLMKEVGLSPVFFAQSLVGGRLPSLVYMISGESQEAHKAHFKAFADSPVWKNLSGDPQYKDTVSKIQSIFLQRTDYSQI